MKKIYLIAFLSMASVAFCPPSASQMPVFEAKRSGTEFKIYYEQVAQFPVADHVVELKSADIESMRVDFSESKTHAEVRKSLKAPLKTVVARYDNHFSTSLLLKGPSLEGSFYVEFIFNEGAAVALSVKGLASKIPTYLENFLKCIMLPESFATRVGMPLLKGVLGGATIIGVGLGLNSLAQKKGESSGDSLHPADSRGLLSDKARRQIAVGDTVRARRAAQSADFSDVILPVTSTLEASLEAEAAFKAEEEAFQASPDFDIVTEWHRHNWALKQAKKRLKRCEAALRTARVDEQSTKSWSAKKQKKAVELTRAKKNAFVAQADLSDIEAKRVELGLRILFRPTPLHFNQYTRFVKAILKEYECDTRDDHMTEDGRLLCGYSWAKVCFQQKSANYKKQQKEFMELAAEEHVKLSFDPSAAALINSFLRK